MKKEGIIIGLLILNFVILIGIIFNLYFSNDVQVVLREEVTPNLINENIDTLCPRLCEERGYDGWQGSGGATGEPQTSSCDCYWLVDSIPKFRIEKYLN